MGKTLRKFSNKGKRTQQQRKTKGKKPIRRKTVRRGRKTGGLGSAAEYVKDQVNQISVLFYKRPRTIKNIGDAKKILNDLSNPKRSCRIMLGFKDAKCEINKEIQYKKASVLADKIIGSESDIYNTLHHKSERVTGEDDYKEQMRQTIQSEKELQIIEILELIKSKPSHYLADSETSKNIGTKKCIPEYVPQHNIKLEDEDKYKSELGLQRIVLDVLEKKYLDENGNTLDPTRLIDISQSAEYIDSKTPLKQYRESGGSGKESRLNESYLASMRCVYTKAVDEYYKSIKKM